MTTPNATAARRTKETDIKLIISRTDLTREIATGIGFFDHMLDALFFHAGLGLRLSAAGDLHVDAHHTIEDTGILLGQALYELLGDKSGMARFASAAIPMDEALAEATIDLSGRPFLVFNDFSKPQLTGASGGYTYDMTEEFLRAVCNNAKITLHINLYYGTNGHHMTEAIFKAVARALRGAMVPLAGATSTKGSIDA
ncbi:MAG: imidazoleglycerol-phosphate dehydratase HisB [Oscillospiraceae bacterium]|nr:imidazoleglycerol-phosphate dehydratase HisB [Oscillospiraceae bacterium]